MILAAAMISRSLASGFEWLYPLRFVAAATALWLFRSKYSELDWRFGGFSVAAGFAVLKAPDIPSILVETAFISNPDEELKLRSDHHQQKFAGSIRDGVARYFAQNPPLAKA